MNPQSREHIGKDLRETGCSRLKKLKQHRREIEEQIEDLENNPFSLSKDDADEETLSQVKEN